MSRLTDDITEELDQYDKVMDTDDAAFGSVTEKEAQVNMAAHDFVAAVRMLLERIEDVGEPDVNLNNPIAKLQERAQAHGEPMPTYTFGREGEDHIPTFRCTCVSGDYTRVAKGKNKQTAKRRAALAVLEATHG